MVQFKDIDYELADILLNSVLKKEMNLTYAEVADELTKRLRRKINAHYNLGVPLGNVSALCFNQLGLPLLSARVIYTGATDAKAIGEGFYPFACEFRPEYKNMNPVAAWKNELKLIRECPHWHRLREYLDGVPIDVIMNRESTSGTDEKDKPQSEETSAPAPKSDFPLSEPIFPDEVDTSVIKEGATKSVNVNVKERNPSARQKCIEYHGTRCTVCDIDLGEMYGAEFSGRIHVHHLNPISEYNGEHEVNPIEELRPVCPNCHMVIHCGPDRPYTVEEVKEMMKKRETKK